MTHSTTVNRASDRELVVTRHFDAPPESVFKAWTTPALMQRWWAPGSFGMALSATNEECEQGAVTTLTFDERDGGTLLTMHELHPSKQALDEAFDGTNACSPEQFAQLDALLAG